MNKLSMQIVALCAFIALASLPALAQNGGKAEPNRIQFKKGAYSTTVTNTVSGDAQAEYIFGAGEGQKITITVTRGALFELFNEDNINLNEGVDSTTFTLEAAQAGDYRVNVFRGRAAPRKMTFRLTVTIK